MKDQGNPHKPQPVISDELQSVIDESLKAKRENDEIRMKNLPKVIAECRKTGDWLKLFIFCDKAYYHSIIENYYEEFPDDKKYELIIGAFTYLEDPYGLQYYLSDIQNYRPENYLEELPKDKIDAKGMVKVYRGTQTPEDHPGESISWTTDYKTALWFAERFPHHGNNTRVYTGLIHVDDIIAYDNSRNESEVIQIDSVCQVREVDREG